MTQIFILQTQSATGAVITIVALLLVAAIIGYFTSWLYAKSVYTPIIKGLENDKANLIRQVDGLNEDVKKLNGTINNLGEKITALEESLKEKERSIADLKKELKADLTPGSK